MKYFKMPRPTIMHEHAVFVINSSILFGLLPVHIIKNGSKSELVVNNQWKKISLAHIFFVMCLVLLIIFKSSYMKTLFATENSILQEVVLTTALTKMLIILFCYVTCSGLLEQDIVGVFNELSEIEKHLSEFGLRRRYWRDIIYQMIHVLIAPVVFITASILKDAISEENRIPTVVIIFHIYIYIICDLADTQFLLLMLVLKQDFAAINKCLTNFSKFRMGEHGLSEIRLLMFLYDKVCKIVHKVTKMYGTILIACTCVHLGETLTFMFDIYQSLKTSKIAITVCEFCLVSIKLFEITRRFTIGHVTIAKSNLTKHLVHRALLKAQDQLLVKELVLFSKQLLHNQVSIAPRGIFPLSGESIYWTVGYAPPLILMLWTYQGSQSVYTCSQNVTSTTVNSNTT